MRTRADAEGRCQRGFDISEALPAKQNPALSGRIGEDGPVLPLKKT